MNLVKLFFFVILFSWSIPFTCFAKNHTNPPDSGHSSIIAIPDSLILLAPQAEMKKVFEPIDSSKVKNFRSKKIIAAVLAFPVPFGLLGLHRLFLGTKPYIPFVYIGTLGGCFLILPILDFIAILSANEESFKKFEENPKVFMWGR